MILGLLLAIAVSVSLASLGIIVTGFSGALKENIVTGAAIGTQGAISYAVITLVLSLIAIFFISLILKRPKKSNFVQ